MNTTSQKRDLNKNDITIALWFVIHTAIGSIVTSLVQALSFLLVHDSLGQYTVIGVILFTFLSVIVKQYFSSPDTLPTSNTQPSSNLGSQSINQVLQEVLMFVQSKKIS